MAIQTVKQEQLTEWRKMTDERIAEIKATPNMVIPADATVYYVSNNGNDENDGKTPATAWASIAKVNEASLNEGDYVLFERGSMWRGQIKTANGVTYSAYGEGPKPVFCTSPENGADPTKWEKVSDTVWAYDTLHWGMEGWRSDIGTMVFNDGECCAYKYLPYTDENGKTVAYGYDVPFTCGEDIKEDLAFYHNTAEGKILLCSKENPGTRFYSIEFNPRLNVFANPENSRGITIDNVSVKYTGAHGIGGGGFVHDLTVTNSEFAWIGGSFQLVNGKGFPVRFGNGVEIYGACDGYTVSNCYFENIYDAALTHQYVLQPKVYDTDMGHYNITVSNNVMEKCVYSIEFFLGLPKEALALNNPSHLDNVVYENNLMWDAGQGLGSQRPDKYTPAHIQGWKSPNYVKRFEIRNNLMVGTTQSIMQLNGVNRNPNGERGISFHNNTVVAQKGRLFGVLGYETQEAMPYDETVEEYIAANGYDNQLYFE